MIRSLVAVLAALCLFLSSIPLEAQANFNFDPTKRTKFVEQHLLMPTSLTAVAFSGVAAGTDVVVTYLWLNNQGATTTITVDAVSEAGIQFFTTTPISAGASYSVPLPSTGLKFASGIRVQSGSGSVSAWITGGVR